MRYLLVVHMLICTVIALTDVNQKCIEDNSELLSNDDLLGSWFRVYRFAPGGWLPPTCYCPEDKYTKPSPDIVQQYKDKYNVNPDLPYSLDENPVQKNEKYWDGNVTGVHRAKFYVLTQNTTARLTDGYQVIAYKPLSKKYLMTTECALRGNFRWLLSREKEPPLEEMENIIKKTPEFKDLYSQRFCYTSNTTKCYY